MYRGEIPEGLEGRKNYRSNGREIEHGIIQKSVDIIQYGDFVEEIHPEHPRSESLLIRKKLADGFKNGLVTPEGLSAHGRGEAFDYILGEETTDQARSAIEASAAALLRADRPVISVNGNTAALVPSEIVELADEVEAKIEVNLFHGSAERKLRIAEHLEEYGAEDILGVDDEYLTEIPEIRSGRRMVDDRGIAQADAVFVPLEDGDRTEALEKLGKDVVTVDLNPMSRTAKAADITVVDNIVRALPKLIEISKDLSDAAPQRLDGILEDFDNEANLGLTLEEMFRRLKGLSQN